MKERQKSPSSAHHYQRDSLSRAPHEPIKLSGLYSSISHPTRLIAAKNYKVSDSTIHGHNERGQAEKDNQASIYAGMPLLPKEMHHMWPPNFMVKLGIDRTEEHYPEFRRDMSLKQDIGSKVTDVYSGLKL